MLESIERVMGRGLKADFNRACASATVRARKFLTAFAFPMMTRIIFRASSNSNAFNRVTTINRICPKIIIRDFIDREICENGSFRLLRQVICSYDEENPPFVPSDKDTSQTAVLPVNHTRADRHNDVSSHPVRGESALGVKRSRFAAECPNA